MESKYQPIFVMGFDSQDLKAGALENLVREKDFRGNLHAVDFRYLEKAVSEYREAGFHVQQVNAGTYVVSPYSIDLKVRSDKAYDRYAQRQVSSLKLYDAVEEEVGASGAIFDAIRKGQKEKAAMLLLENKELVFEAMAKSGINRNRMLLENAGNLSSEFGASGMARGYLQNKMAGIYDKVKGYLSGFLAKGDLAIAEVYENMGLKPREALQTIDRYEMSALSRARKHKYDST